MICARSHVIHMKSIWRVILKWQMKFHMNINNSPREIHRSVLYMYSLYQKAQSPLLLTITRNDKYQLCGQRVIYSHKKSISLLHFYFCTQHSCKRTCFCGPISSNILTTRNTYISTQYVHRPPKVWHHLEHRRLARVMIPILEYLLSMIITKWDYYVIIIS